MTMGNHWQDLIDIRSVGSVHHQGKYAIFMLVRYAKSG